MEHEYKEVDFTYCDTCKYRDVDETKDPCHECLSNPINLHSKKPIKFEERKKK